MIIQGSGKSAPKKPEGKQAFFSKNGLYYNFLKFKRKIFQSPSFFKISDYNFVMRALLCFFLVLFAGGCDQEQNQEQSCPDIYMVHWASDEAEAEDIANCKCVKDEEGLWVGKEGSNMFCRCVHCKQKNAKK